MTTHTHPDYSTWSPTDISPHQTEFATEHRVPFLATPFPEYSYIGGIVVESEYYGGGEIPTEEEVLLVEQWINDYKARWLNNWFVETMKNFGPYDLDIQANTFLFIKYAADSWAYRRTSWEVGLFYNPPFANGEGVRLTLSEVVKRG